MSTTFPPPPVPQAPRTVLNVEGTPPVGFARLCQVELRKSYDTRAGSWYLFTIATLIVLVESIVLIVSLAKGNLVRFEDNAYIAGAITSLLLPVLAIMLVTSEWSQRSAMVSFTLEPRRARVVLAKLVVSIGFVVATIAVMLALAVLTAGISQLVQPDLTNWDFQFTGLIGFAIFQAITMTIGFAFASLLLNTPGAIVLFFLYWYLLPGLLAWASFASESVGKVLDWINFQAAVAPLADWEMNTGEEWGKLLVSGLIWVVLPLGLGISRILKAEVK